MIEFLQPAVCHDRISNTVWNRANRAQFERSSSVDLGLLEATRNLRLPRHCCLVIPALVYSYSDYPAEIGLSPQGQHGRKSNVTLRGEVLRLTGGEGLVTSGGFH